MKNASCDADGGLSLADSALSPRVAFVEVALSCVGVCVLWMSMLSWQ